MARYAEIIGSDVTRVIIADGNDLPETTGRWEDVTSKAVNRGATARGDGTFTPRPRAVSRRLRMSVSEWIQLFTAGEWQLLKTERATNIELDQIMDAIVPMSELDIESAFMDSFYAIMDTLVTPARAIALRAGLEELI